MFIPYQMHILIFEIHYNEYDLQIHNIKNQRSLLSFKRKTLGNEVKYLLYHLQDICLEEESIQQIVEENNLLYEYHKVHNHDKVDQILS